MSPASHAAAAAALTVSLLAGCAGTADPTPRLSGAIGVGGGGPGNAIPVDAAIDRRQTGEENADARRR